MASLGDKNVGDIVKIKEDGTAVNYIIVQKGKPSDLYDDSCDGVWLLREYFHSYKKWHSTNVNDYKNSDIEAWINGDFLSAIDEKIRAVIKTVRIPYKEGIGNSGTVQSGANGLSCKAFLLSGYEVGFTYGTNLYIPADGAKLAYFSGNVSRIGTNSSGTAGHWWTRSPNISGGTYNGQCACFVHDDGDGSTNFYVSNYELGIRPAFVLPSTLLVGEDGTVSTNSLPEITSDTPSGTDLGEISDGFDLSYTVSDEDGDAMTVSEYVDDTLTCSIDSPEGGEYTFGAVSGENWKTILNGSHTLKIVANDGKANSNAYTVTFNKQKRTATISLAEPLPADDVIRAAAIAVTGHFPEDSTLTVLVTNNALDDSPVWEDMSASVANSSNHVFTNQTAANGFAFNFRITATRGASDEQGYISSIGGAFE